MLSPLPSLPCYKTGRAPCARRPVAQVPAEAWSWLADTCRQARAGTSTACAPALPNHLQQYPLFLNPEIPGRTTEWSRFRKKHLKRLKANLSRQRLLLSAKYHSLHSWSKQRFVSHKWPNNLAPWHNSTSWDTGVLLRETSGSSNKQAATAQFSATASGKEETGILSQSA